MQEFHPLTMLAIAQEMLGDLWWPAVALAGLVVLLWIMALVAGRLRSGRFGRALGPAALLGVVAGMAVAAMLPGWTESSFQHFGGAVDYVANVSAGVAVAVAVCVILVPVVAFLRSAR